ncbi:penicillin-binding protein 1B [Lysobacter sp. H23M47]|uniref:penicillin-binding protein 1B n=1 Tax=Lysobacter sp. H23M47 TaxID=2781024 RepID=UPI00187F31C2|nr:penicillin-binding protein 1B [Lysobacter sp. H23M47]QOW24111.1 penicillin-binding protein 1B [Lysobacter sp. H23M47]
MARIDYDEDDVEQGDSPGPRWPRLLSTAILATIGLGLGFLIPYSLYLNHEVGQRFDQLRWQLPTRVYGRPLELAPGVAMDAGTLEVELRAAGYHAGDGVRPGTYLHDDANWKISSRGFNDVDGAVAPRMAQLTLGRGRVAKLEATGGKGAPPRLRLDPARIATLYGQKQEERRLVQLDEVPELLVTGLQAVEDRDFASHHGIDLSGIVRAAWINMRSGEARQGASTLTQQLARSGLLGIGREQTYTRKFNEIIYALLMEARYDKRLILEAYFNQVYMGQRGAQAIHGMAAASEFWFGRDLADLNTEQIALLIGIVRGPSYYDPRRNPERATQRRNFVLDRMLESTLIDAAEHARAQEAPLGISTDPGRTSANRFPAYVDLVRRQLARDYSSEALAGAGLSVMTAMAPSAQAYAEGAVIKTLKGLEGKNRPALQAGVVVTDVEHGDVLAVVGSGTPAQPGFNRAVEAQRPVGSLLKPFVYLLALASPQQWSLASWVDDSPVTVILGNGKRWTPGNSDGRSHGTVRLIDALARSYNQATVRVGMQVAPARIAELVHTLAGITAEPNPALILGSLDQSPYAMAQLYQFLASGGEIQPLHSVRGVLDTEGKALNRYDDRPDAAQEGDMVFARLVTIALQRAVTAGTGRQLVADGLGHLNAAGKTGTSNDGRDSWFAGYTGDHLAVVWVGNDQNEATGLFGATGGMRVWSNLFKLLPSAPLKVGDEGIDWQWVSGSNVSDASCPGASRFAFANGYAPAYMPCRPAAPEMPAEAAPSAGESGSRGGWREWFGFGSGRRNDSQDTDTEPQDSP